MKKENSMEEIYADFAMKLALFTMPIVAYDLAKEKVWIAIIPAIIFILLLTILFIFSILLIDAVKERPSSDGFQAIGRTLNESPNKTWDTLVNICLIGFWILVGLTIVMLIINNI